MDLKLAVPKGRLLTRSQAAVDTFADAVGPRLGIHPFFLRIQDIPTLVGENLLDVGITSDEWITEHTADAVPIAPLCWYHAAICVIGVPGSRPRSPVRVVTEYESIASKFASRRWGELFTLRTVYGAVEEYLPELADIAIECVETGASIRRRGLSVLETLFPANVWVVCSPRVALDRRVVTQLLSWASSICEGDQHECGMVCARSQSSVDNEPGGRTDAAARSSATRPAAGLAGAPRPCR